MFGNMDKKTLNNEIVLCRAAVRKAKVAVIRKIIKKMKILKACKVEAVKEKKLKKSERLFEKVQIMKRIKSDEVTKFALRNKDLESFLKGPTVDLKQNALACLAQHDAVIKKINSIRERIPNWEAELTHLLDSLGRKKKKMLNDKKESTKSTNNSVKSEEKSVKKGGGNKNKEKRAGKVQVEQGTTKQSKRQAKYQSDSEESAKSEASNTSMTENPPDSDEIVDKIEKIIDPFFIGKKVIAPKLALQNVSSGTNEDKIGKSSKPSFKRENRSSLFHTKPHKSKDDVRKLPDQKNYQKTPQLPTKTPQEEKLHPSWAAKKVELIKPFQGKKIKFSDD